MSNIKDYFISRYYYGTLMEFDYSQLEIIALAILSNDSVLKSDIFSGTDLHTVRAAQMFRKKEEHVTKEERRIAKVFSFQLQYGSGAKNMAADQGVSVALAQSFIDGYYDRYPDVKIWQDNNLRDVVSSRRPSQKLAEDGRGTIGFGYLVSPTGRRYVFYEDMVHKHQGFNGGVGSKYKFSPTKIKNYPVQGFATADIVPIMLGEVFSLLNTTEFFPIKPLLINTVHDSILIDVDTNDPETLKFFGGKVKEKLESAPAIMKELFNINITLPLKVDVEFGKTWGSMKKLDI
jgi:DNA polymerase I